MTTKHSTTPLVIGIAGFGTVASGVCKILEENKDVLLAHTGREIKVKSIIVKDLNKKRPLNIPTGASIGTDLLSLVEDPEIDTVVELIGGVDSAKVLVKAALNAGKNVVTANKALLASCGTELFKLALEKNVTLSYEASVCGGIPVIKVIKESLVANKINSICGILNGTCNFILSEMTDTGSSFENVLKEAQALGYAEADPTLDVEGIDAAHKLSILINLAWGMDYYYDKIPVEGIRNTSAMDISFAKSFGCQIRLIGQARMVDGKIQANIAPFLIPDSSLLAKVHGPFNAVQIECNAAGPIFLHGKGAGDLATGSAVMADIISIAKEDKPNNTGWSSSLKPVKVLNSEDCFNSYYMRLMLKDSSGVLRDVAGIMAKNHISIAEASQKSNYFTDDSSEEERMVPFVIMTHKTSVSNMKKALKELEQQDFIHGKPVCYAVLL